MKQMTFADAEYAGKRKQIRRELFLVEMDQWPRLIALIEPHYPKGEGGRPAYPLMAMLRVHLMQNWFGYSDPAMEEALYETTILRQFSGLSLERIPYETTILNFCRLLEKHELAPGTLAVINGYLGDRGLSLRQGTIVDATLIHAPSSTKKLYWEQAHPILKIKEACEVGNASACKNIKFTEAGSFAGGLTLGSTSGWAASRVAGVVCISLAGVNLAVCSVAIVGASELTMGTIGSTGGEWLGEVIYESVEDE